MQHPIEVLNLLLLYWAAAPWYVALIMAIATNIAVYTVSASTLDFIISRLTLEGGWARYIDNRDLKPGQRTVERKNGIVACCVFAATSLLTREIYHEIWPGSIYQLAVQLIVFTIFYESYSYCVHRLLHTNRFIKFHGVHHWSVRVTPWSAYSVHIIEAIFIGISAPLFMMVFPMDLGVVLGFHVLGMMFTILLHSNCAFKSDFFAMKNLSKYAQYHRSHHLVGNVNFGFINSFWDKLLRTGENR